MHRSPWLIALLLLAPAAVLLTGDALSPWAGPAALLWLGGLFLALGLLTRRWLSHTPADLVLLVMLLLLPLGLWVSVDRAETLQRTYAFVANVAIFYALAVQSRDRRLQSLAGWGLLAAGLLLTVVTVPGTRFSLRKFPFLDRDLYDLLPHFGGLPGGDNGFNANMTAGVLAPFLPVALALSLHPQARGQRFMAIFTLALMGTAVLLTQSRGALLGVAAGIILVTGVRYRGLRWVWGAIILLASGWAIWQRQVLLEWLLSMEATFGRNPVLGRMEIWQRAMTMGVDFPFTGVGLGMFQPVSDKLYPVFVYGSVASDIPHPHNIFLWALAEMGYPGLIAWTALLLVLGGVLVRRYRAQTAPWSRTLALGLLGSWLVFVIHGLVDVPTYSPLSALVIWGLFGMMMAVGLAGDRSATAGGAS